HHGGADEPGEHPRQGRVAEQERRGVRGEGEAGRAPDQVGGAGAVAVGEAAHQASRNSIERTHFVQRTPGSAGTTIRAGKPWSRLSSAPLTRSASSASG